MWTVYDQTTGIWKWWPHDSYKLTNFIHYYYKDDNILYKPHISQNECEE